MVLIYFLYSQQYVIWILFLWRYFALTGLKNCDTMSKGLDFYLIKG